MPTAHCLWNLFLNWLTYLSYQKQHVHVLSPSVNPVSIFQCLFLHSLRECSSKLRSWPLALVLELEVVIVSFPLHTLCSPQTADLWQMSCTCYLLQPTVMPGHRLPVWTLPLFWLSLEGWKIQCLLLSASLLQQNTTLQMSPDALRVQGPVLSPLRAGLLCKQMGGIRESVCGFWLWQLPFSVSLSWARSWQPQLHPAVSNEVATCRFRGALSQWKPGLMIEQDSGSRCHWNHLEALKTTNALLYNSRDSGSIYLDILLKISIHIYFKSFWSDSNVWPGCRVTAIENPSQQVKMLWNLPAAPYL